MTAIAETAAELPPVIVVCTRCSHQWQSRARQHVTIRCPSCRCGVRVKRTANNGPSVAQPLPQPAPLTDTVAAQCLGQEDDDDGPTYIYDEGGRLVLAEWTEDGYLAAARPHMNHAAELAARGYVIARSVEWGACPIINTRGISLGPCAGGAFREFGPYRVCEKHHQALTTPLSARSQPA